MAENPLVSAIIVSYNRKADCLECVDSVLRSDYAPIEVMVVDNASSDGTVAALKENFGNRIRVIASEKNIYAGGGRNLGAKYAGGEYLLFIDSDNIIDQGMIGNLIKGILEDRDLKVGICGPFTYYRSHPKRLCWLNNSISLITSRTSFTGTGIADTGQFDTLDYLKVDHIPNLFMLKRDLFNAVGGIDRDYVMHYEESDLAQKVRALGYDIALFPRAKTWHNLPMRSPKGHKSFSGQNSAMVYYVARNRIIFMRKNSQGLSLLAFLMIFSNLFLLYNLIILALNRQFSLIRLACKGYIDGLTLPLK